MEDFIYSIIVARLTHLREVEENREKETIGTQSIRQKKKSTMNEKKVESSLMT